MSFLGGSPFGSGSLNLGGNVFGGQSPQQQPMTNMFATPATSTGTMFGSTPQKVFTFGTANTTGGLFGSQSNNIFGGGGTTTIGTSPGGGGLFGGSGKNASTTTGLFQTQQPTGTSVPFEAFKDTDTIMKSGTTTSVAVKFQTITVMKQYNQEKSLEELRLEDYQLNRHRKTTQQSTGLFGSTVPTPPPQPSLFTSSNNNPFGSTATTTTTTTASTSFGGSGLFGQQSNNNSTESGNLFGSGLFSQQKPNLSTGLFGNTATTTSAFGSGGASTGFGSQTTGLFGQAQQAPATTGFNFGSATPNLFSIQPKQQQTTQPQQGFGLFSQPTASTTTSNLFGGTSSAFGGSLTTAKPLFTLGGSSFGTTSSTVTPSFGTTTSTTATPSFFGTGPSLTTSAFGATPVTSSAPLSFFGTPQQNPPTSTATPSIFGAVTPSAFSTPTTSTSQGLTGATLASGFFNPTANQQQRPVATGGFFGSGGGGFGAANTTAFRPTLGSLGSGGTASFGTGFTFQPPQIPQQQQLQQQRQPIQSYPSILAPPTLVSFGTTPFKDNKLFYNLLPPNEVISSSRQSNMDILKPDREYLKTSFRRTRLSGTGPSWPSINISSTPSVRRLTYLSNGSNHCSISKYKAKIFDGFEEEDLGVGVDILSPKSSVKRLDLKALEDPLLKIPLQNPGTPSSTRLAQRSREIQRERRRSAEIEDFLKNSSNNNTPVAASSPLLRNRRVRFTLPSFPSVSDGENIPSPIYYPGEENVSSGDCDTGLGDSQGSNSASVLQSSGDAKEVAVLLTPPVMKKPMAPGSICRVVNTREGYYVRPSLEELDKKVDAEGNCFVMELEIGRKNFGRIKFLCPVNVVNINIDKLVNFRHKEVVVYPDDNKKPPLGQGLNVPAVIYLERVWPVDKTTNELVRNPDHVLWGSYEHRLQRACNRMGAEFISYNSENGIWSFKVSHF